MTSTICFDNTENKVITKTNNGVGVSKTNINTIFSNPTVPTWADLVDTPTESDVISYLGTYLKTNNKYTAYSSVLNDIDVTITASSKTIDVTASSYSRQYEGTFRFLYTSVTPIDISQIFSGCEMSNLVSIPGYINVKTYLKNFLVNNNKSQYLNVLNQISIDVVADSQEINLSASTMSIGYSGNVTFNYSLIPPPADPIVLTTLIPNNDSLNTKETTPWSSMPSREDFLSALSEKYTGLQINAVDVDMEDAINLVDLEYSILITPTSGSTYYSGQTNVKFWLQDERKDLSDVFTTIGYDINHPFLWITTYYSQWSSPITNYLNRICEPNNVDSETFIPNTFTMSISAKTSTVGDTPTLTITTNNNPYYKDDTITLYIKIVAMSTFTYTLDQCIQNGTNWGGTVSRGTLTFCVIDSITKEVAVYDTCKVNSAVDSISSTDLQIGDTITNNGVEYTVTSLPGCQDIPGFRSPSVAAFGGSLVSNIANGTIKLPNTITWIGKDVFRSTAVANVIWQKGEKDRPIINSDNRNAMFIGANIINFEVPNRMASLGAAFFGTTTIRNIYFYSSKNFYLAKPGYETILYNSSVVNSFINGGGKFYVTENMYNKYLNDSGYISMMGSAVNLTNSLAIIPKLQNCLPTQFATTSTTPEGMLSDLCTETNIDPAKFRNFSYKLELNPETKTLTILTWDNPNFYGSAILSYTN
ncbi:MAG: hypothetical protein LBL60_00850 [Mycoplasmataceae bacterium]|nr:hypothetical protein [Mycoplasmataceae bacterium]